MQAVLIGTGAEVLRAAVRLARLAAAIAHRREAGIGKSATSHLLGLVMSASR